MQRNPICPKCGQLSKKLLTCYGARYYCCDLWAWGEFILVDKTTHDLRKLVHSKFDPIWKNGVMTRREAYKKLSKKLSIPFEKCHFKMMDKEMLSRALITVETIKETQTCFQWHKKEASQMLSKKY